MSELAQRYRAARAWADLDQIQLAERLGVDRQTVIRRENGTQDPKRSELLAVAAICELPPEFMLYGFADEVLGTEETRTISARLDAIGALLTELLSPPDAGEQLEQELSEDDPPSEQPGDGTGEDEHGQSGAGQ